MSGNSITHSSGFGATGMSDDELNPVVYHSLHLYKHMNGNKHIDPDWQCEVLESTDHSIW